MENLKNPDLGKGAEDLTDESIQDLLGVKNKGKKKRRNFTNEEGAEENKPSKRQRVPQNQEPEVIFVEEPQNIPGGNNNVFAEKLDKIIIPTPKVAEKSKEQVEQKEDVVAILDGISKEETVAGILGLVRKAFKNEVSEEAKSNYTLILDTLERIVKKVNNPQEKVDIELLDKLSEKFNLKNTVERILGPDKIKVEEKAEIPEVVINKKDIPENSTAKIINENVPAYISDTPEAYDEARINEVRNFVDKSVDNMSVRALMEEFALDKETAKGYLAAALGVEIEPKKKQAPEEKVPAVDEKKEKTKETPEQILNKIATATTIEEIIDLVKQAGGVTNSDGLFVSADDTESNLRAIEEQAKIYSENKEEATKKETAGEDALPEFVLARGILKNYYLKLLTHKHGLRDKVREILGVEDLASSKNIEDEEKAPEIKTKEVLSDEKIAELNKAFDTPGFLEFLAKNPDKNFDIEDTDNSEKVLKMHEAFLIKNEVSKYMSVVVSQELNSLAGISNMESLASLEGYINSQSYENPEKILEYKKEVEMLSAGRQQVADLQKQFSEKTAELPLGKITTDEEADLEMINTTVDASRMGPVAKKIISQFTSTAELARTWDEGKNISAAKELAHMAAIGLKFFLIDTPYALYQLTRINSKENTTSRNEAREKIAKMTGEKYSRKSVGKYIDKLIEQKAKSAELVKLEKEVAVSNMAYEVYKKFTATEMMKINGVIDDAGKKIKNSIGKILETKDFDLKESEEAQNILETVQGVMAKNEGLEFLSAEDQVKLQAAIDRKTQEIILNQIQKAFEVGKKVKGPFSNIEKSLKTILEKNKIGSKEGADVRKMVKDSLILVGKQLNDPIINIKIKAFILTNKL